MYNLKLKQSLLALIDSYKKQFGKSCTVNTVGKEHVICQELVINNQKLFFVFNKLSSKLKLTANNVDFVINEKYLLLPFPITKAIYLKETNKLVTIENNIPVSSTEVEEIEKQIYTTYLKEECLSFIKDYSLKLKVNTIENINYFFEYEFKDSSNFKIENNCNRNVYIYSLDDRLITHTLTNTYYNSSNNVFYTNIPLKVEKSLKELKKSLDATKNLVSKNNELTVSEACHLFNKTSEEVVSAFKKLDSFSLKKTTKNLEIILD